MLCKNCKFIDIDEELIERGRIYCDKCSRKLERRYQRKMNKFKGKVREGII